MIPYRGKKYVSFFKDFEQALVPTHTPSCSVGAGCSSFRARAGDTLNYPHLVIMSKILMCVIPTVLMQYRVIHKSLWDFRTRLRNNQDRHGRNEHINR